MLPSREATTSENIMLHVILHVLTAKIKTFLLKVYMKSFYEKYTCQKVGKNLFCLRKKKLNIVSSSKVFMINAT